MAYPLGRLGVNPGVSETMNSLEKSIRKFLKLPLTLALRTRFFRKRIAYHFRYEYFADLELSIPLSHGFWCPIPMLDAFDSFSEIFVTHEYGSFLDEIPLPRRWVDLGCHVGYFTLYLAWQHALAESLGDWRALLIDADPRSEAFMRKTLAQNSLLPKCEYRAGLISKQPGEPNFALRGGMGSSSDTSMGGIQSLQKVRTIGPAEILAALPPPYDLIKIDVEGAEIDFIEAYREVHTHAVAILIEWHSPDKEGSREKDVRELLEGSDFSLAREIRPRHTIKKDAGWYSSGVQLYRRAST
jgi:FkbM family methyltransferase